MSVNVPPATVGRREMKHDLTASGSRVGEIPVPEVSFLKIYLFEYSTEIIQFPATKVVSDTDLRAGTNKFFYEMTADKGRSAGDKNRLTKPEIHHNRNLPKLTEAPGLMYGEKVGAI